MSHAHLGYLCTYALTQQPQPSIIVPTSCHRSLVEAASERIAKMHVSTSVHCRLLTACCAVFARFRKALRSHPNAPAEVRLGIGAAAFKLGRHDTARSAFQRALQLQPRCVPALAGLAVLAMYAPPTADVSQRCAVPMLSFAPQYHSAWLPTAGQHLLSVQVQQWRQHEKSKGQTSIRCTRHETFERY